MNKSFSSVMSIKQYFTKVSTAEEAIPQEWKDSPLPPARKKRAVGRPRKRGDIQSEIPVPVPVDIESEVVDVERPADTAKPESQAADKPTPKRGKYKSFSVKEKLDILAESQTFGVRATCRLHKITPSTLCTWKKADFSVQRGKGGRITGGGRKLSYAQDTDSQIIQWIMEQRDLHSRLHHGPCTIMCTAKPPHIPGYTWLAREVYDTPQSITKSQDQYITEVAS